MPSIETLLTFSVAALLLSLSPGPSNLYIMARSLGQGYRAGIAAASGMALGSLSYVLVTALGLAAIFTYSPFAYTALKICGALYLVYLGWQYLTSHTTAPDDQKLTRLSFGKIFRQSVLVELTNPKTALFFLAFLPQFVDPKVGSVVSQLIILGGLYAVIAFCCDLLVAALSTVLGQFLQRHPDFADWQDRVTGSILIVLAGFLLIDTAQRSDMTGSDN